MTNMAASPLHACAEIIKITSTSVQSLTRRSRHTEI
jgi:hypothetical protein